MIHTSLLLLVCASISAQELDRDPSDLMDMSPEEIRSELLKASAVPNPESGPFLLEGLAALMQTDDEQGLSLSPSALQQKESLVAFEAAFKSLLYMADERLLPDLKAMAGSRNLQLAGAAIRLLGVVGGREASGALRKIAEGADRERRSLALLALADTRAKPALDILEKASRGPDQLATRYAHERLQWQLGLAEPAARGQKMAALLYAAIDKPRTSGWQINAEPLTGEAANGQLSAADLVILGSAEGPRLDYLATDGSVQALRQVLDRGGTLAVLTSGRRLPAALSSMLGKLKVKAPQQWQAGQIRCRPHYADFHPILVAPYDLGEVRPALAAPGGWKKWASAQRAPFRDRLRPGISPFVFQRVGKGTVILSALDLLGESFLRENLYSSTLGSEYRGPKSFVWKMSHEWVSPHREWSKPTPGGKVRVLFLMPRLFKRAIVEIAQRLDMEYAFVPLLTAMTEGAKKGRETQARYTMSGETAEELQRLVGKPWDLIVVGNLSIQGTGYYRTFCWADVPLHLKRFVRDKVEAGCGLAFLSGGSAAHRRIGVNPSWPIASSSEAAELDFQFPFAKPSLSLRRLGKGRLLFLNSPLPFMNVWDPGGRGKAKGFVEPGVEVSRVVFPTEEYRYAALTKALLWAAGREPAVQIAKLRAAPGAPQSSVEVTLAGKTEGDLAVEIAVRDRFDRALHRATVRVSGRTCEIAIPRLPEGSHVIDCILRNGAGESLDYAALQIRVSSTRSIRAARPDKSHYQAGDEAKLKVSLTNAQGLTLSWKLIDTYDRLVHEGKVAAGQDRAEVVIPVEAPRSRLHYAWLSLCTPEGHIVSVHRQPLLALTAQPADYRWYQAGGSSSNFAVQLAAAGVDCINLPTEDSEIVDIALESNIAFWSAWSHIGAGYAGRGNAEGTGHSVCPSGPAFRYALRSNFESSVPRAKKYGVELFMLQDESSAGIGACNQPPCVFAFQNCLRGHYGSVAALNRAWKTDFTSWDEVRRTAVTDLTALAPGVDHAMFMRRLYAEWIDQCQGGIRQTIPDARVGFSVSWGDAWELSRYLSLTIWHRRVLYYDYHHSYGRPETVFGTWYGPTYNKSDRNEAQAHHDVWAALLGGANAFFEWWGARHLGYNFVRPDLSLFDIARVMSKQVQEIKGGIGKLLIESERVTLPVALYRSSRSGLAAGLLAKESKAPEDQKQSGLGSLRGTLRRLQVPIRYIHSEQIEDGILAQEHIRLVVMSRPIALSDLEGQGLTRFVREGGILVVDYDAGLRDEHGNLREAPLLAEVFGVRLARSRKVSKPAALSIKHDFEELNLAGVSSPLSPKSFGTGIAVGSGRALGTIAGDVPAFVVNRYGKGLAVYLNFHPAGVRPEQGTDFVRTLWEKLIAQARIEMPFRVESKDGQLARLRTGVFRNGEQWYVGFSADPQGDSLAEQTKRPLTVKCAREGYLYDIRNGKSLGKRRLLAVTHTPGLAMLFSLLPYAPEGLDVSCSSASVGLGRTIHVRAKLRTSGAVPGKHVFVFRVTDAKGRQRREHDHNALAEQGQCQVDVPIALNDPRGSWTVSVRDVATGITTQATFDVVPR